MRVRAWGRGLLGPAFNYLLFLRPRQWPILTGQLAVGVLAAPACAEPLLTSLGDRASLPALTLGWLGWVVCLNGGTLAFNSAYDRDEKDIAYLRRPPAPPRFLAPFAVALMLLGVAAAFALTCALGWLTACCVVLSILYSHPAARWKGRPGLDLAVNMTGYGGGTTLAGLLVGQVACGGARIAPEASGWLLVAGFALLFGSLYPMTQIYQLTEDSQRGDRTLASALGARRSVILALILGGAASLLLLTAAAIWHRAGSKLPLLPLAAALIAWLVHAGYWLGRIDRWGPRRHERGMYTALTIWAAIDLAVLASRYGKTWLG